MGMLTCFEALLNPSMRSILDSGLDALSLGEEGALCRHQICACGVAKWGDGCHLQEGRPEVVFKWQGSHFSPFLGRSVLGYDRGECNCDLNLRHQSKVMVVLVVQQWASWAVRLTIIHAFCRYKAYCMTKKHPLEGIPGIWGGTQSLDMFFQLILKI